MTHEKFEEVVMEKLLDGNDVMLTLLREQYSHATVVSREFTGRGFFTTFNIPDHLVKNLATGRIDDVMAKFYDSEVYYFILYITDGKIDTLEGFSTLNYWKYNYDEAVVVHCFENKRDFYVKLN